MSNKVLVPLDGSELAECTLSHVKHLCRDGVAGEVTLLNIVKFDFPWELGRSEQDIQNFDLNALREKFFAKSRNYLADKKSLLASEGIQVKTESLESNRPADAITEYALKNGIDMIIIGTHGYTGLKKLMMGSVAFSVLHQSPVPVLLIRPESCRI